MYVATAARLTQRIRERCGLERSRLATPAEVLSAASAGVAWTVSLITAVVPGYYDGLYSTGDLFISGAMLSTPIPPWRLRYVGYAPLGGRRFTPLRIVTLAEALDDLADAGGTTPRTASLATGIDASGGFGGGILIGPTTVDATQWEWIVNVGVMPGLVDLSSTVPMPTPLWEEAAVVYGAIQLLEKQELPTAQLWTHLQALEARLRELTLAREDSGQAGVRERRLQPLEEELWGC